MDDAKAAEICDFDIKDYGTCGKRRDHLVHMMLGMSSREHPFHRELKGKVETAVLSKRNLRKISRASGTSVEDLEIMRQMGIKKGKKITVRYEVKENN